MSIPASTIVQALDPDPRRQVEECLLLLACSIDRLRNQAGTGHGRPSSQALPDAEARLAARATALVAGSMLDRL